MITCVFVERYKNHKERKLDSEKTYQILEEAIHE